MIATIIEAEMHVIPTTFAQCIRLTVIDDYETKKFVFISPYGYTINSLAAQTKVLLIVKQKDYCSYINLDDLIGKIISVEDHGNPKHLFIRKNYLGDRLEYKSVPKRKAS